jgi:GNAT superfamily N-acetyltransferase
LFVPVVPSQLVEWFNAVLASSSQRVWLAVIDGKAAGYLLAAIQDRPATPFSPPRRWCEIDQLGVHEEMRGRGVARALVSAALDWAREEGAARVSAQCWSFNSVAQRAFARLGFTPMTVRLEYGSGEGATVRQGAAPEA